MFIQRINVLIISFYIAIAPILLITKAHATDNGDWWLQRQIQLQQNREDYARRVYGSARHTYDTVDPVTSKTKTITKIAIVEDVPSKQKLGKVLLERAKKYKGGIAGVLGGAAVTALIEAVGWVMEDGTYVKYKPIEKPNCNTNPDLCGPYLWNGVNDGKKYNTAQDSCEAWNQTLNNNMGGGWVYKGVTNQQTTTATCLVQYFTNTAPNEYQLTATQNQNYDPNTQPQSEKITITDQDVGGIASGDYQDPVDPNYNITDKQFRPVVADAYQHDPTNTGNDLANEMDDRLKTAPPTSDGKPAPIGDTRYSTAPQEDKTTNDRTWNDDGSTAIGDTTPTTDPTTGQPTGGQSISLQFPIFCEWAHTMCKWYDDWKVSDTVYKEHMTKTEEHQTEEKGFWGRVDEFFTWTKEDELPEKQDLDPESEDTTVLQEVNINWGAQCPEKQSITFEMLDQSIEIPIINFETVCPFAPIIKPIVIFSASLESLYILAGIRRTGGAENE